MLETNTKQETPLARKSTIERANKRMNEQKKRMNEQTKIVLMRYNNQTTLTARDKQKTMVLKKNAFKTAKRSAQNSIPANHATQNTPNASKLQNTITQTKL